MGGTESLGPIGPCLLSQFDDWWRSYISLIQRREGSLLSGGFIPGFKKAGMMPPQGQSIPVQSNHMHALHEISYFGAETQI
jgi:hypothetical protein